MSWKNTTARSVFDSRLDPESIQNRVKILALFFIIFSVLIVWRLFSLQIIKGDFYGALALGQHELYQKLFPERGSIFVIEEHGTRQTLFPLVTNRDLNMLYASPKEIKNPYQTAEKLVEILGISNKVDEQEMAEIEKVLFADISPDLNSKMVEEIKEIRRQKWHAGQMKIEIERLTQTLSKKNDPYEPIRHRLNDQQVEQIKSLNIKGLYFKKETVRFYPEQGMGGHIFGFLGFDKDCRKGEYGLEGYFDNVLAGQSGEIRSEKDVWGNIIAVGSNFFNEKIDGSDLVLTIDRAIQYKTCQVLYRAVEDFEAIGGSVIVVNPRTGAVLAMCGAPDFNPEEYYNVESIDVYNNPAIFYPYEPGSIIKPITMAIALDTGRVEPQTIYEDKGKLVINKETIKNYQDKIYGRQTMTEVLEKSINTGAVWAMRQASKKVFVKYFKDFGLGRKTGIKLDTEMAGDVSNLDRPGEIYAATASYGHGIALTPLQIVSAISAIANNGKLMRPYIVSQIISNEDKNLSADKRIKNFQPQEIGQIVSSKTARMLSAMMVSVVESGHAKLAGINGYRVAGKTGTAIIADKVGGGYTDEVIVSFVGFAPFADPKFAMIVRIDKPQHGKTGSSVAAPIFSDIAKFILQYYNVPYDK